MKKTKMKNNKTNEQLLKEIGKLKDKIAELEKFEAGREQAENDLKESEKRFKQLIKNSFDMIVLLNSNGIQHFVSESCEKILGYQSEELINIPVIERMIHPDDQERAISGLQNIINTGSGNAQYRHRHKSGGWVYLEAFGSNQINNPHINSLVLNVRDITKQKEVEEELAKHRENLEESVKERTKKLEDKNRELDRAMKVFVGRELKIRDLEQRIKALEEEK